MKVTRREFFSLMAAGGAALYAAFFKWRVISPTLFYGPGGEPLRLPSKIGSAPERSPVSVRRGKNVERIVHQSLEDIGGIRDLVRGKSVYIKPNGRAAAHPGDTTNPEVLKAVIREVRRAGAASIVVGETCSIGVVPEEAYAGNELRAAIEDCGLSFVNLRQERGVRVEVPVGELGMIETFEPVVASDVVISVPVLKWHVVADVTMGLKNMKGAISDRTKRRIHSLGVHRGVAQMATVLKPDLVVTSGVEALTPHGLERMGLVLAGFDPVAVDATGARLLGYDPAEVEYLRDVTGQYTLGNLALEKIDGLGDYGDMIDD